MFYKIGNNLAFRLIDTKELFLKLAPEVEAFGDPTRATRQRAEARRPPPTVRTASPDLHRCAGNNTIS
jgi:hypothetical protein